MKAASGVDTIELTMNILGQKSLIHPSIIHDNSSVILVDTGLPGQVSDIREAMNQRGIPLSKISSIIITHQDFDHIGSLKDMLEASDHKIEVIAHEAEAPYIQGEKPYIKANTERMNKILESLPPKQRELTDSALTAIHVDKEVRDGEVLPYCGGITVIYTPGHTPGHISLYLNKSKILIAGDALVVVNDELMGPVPPAAIDIDEANKSLKKFTQYDIETVVCYHGGIYTNNVNQRIAELI